MSKTYYELFQLEKYGNILPESDASPLLLEEDEMITNEHHPELIQDNKFTNQ